MNKWRITGVMFGVGALCFINYKFKLIGNPFTKLLESGKNDSKEVLNEINTANDRRIPGEAGAVDDKECVSDILKNEKYISYENLATEESKDDLVDNISKLEKSQSDSSESQT